MDVYSELIRAQAEVLSTDPSPGVKGRFYHKSTTEPLKVDDGTTLHKVVTDQTVNSYTPKPYQTLATAVYDFSSALFAADRAMGPDWDSPIPAFIYIASADFPSISGLTPKLRIRGQILTNATTPGSNFIFKLIPVTATAGASGSFSYTSGAAVAGLTATITTPASSSMNVATSSKVALPSDGYYFLAVENTVILPAGEPYKAIAQLQVVYE